LVGVPPVLVLFPLAGVLLLEVFACLLLARAERVVDSLVSSLRIASTSIVIVSNTLEDPIDLRAFLLVP
jgi:hypothetical protein